MTHRRRRIPIILIAIVFLAIATNWLAPAPASAETFTPTNSEARIVSITPESNLVVLKVLGGDGALRLRVEPGHEAVVFGYQNEPYLRISAEGDIETNLNSPATYTNATRSGDVAVPDIDSDLPPDWKRIGHGQSVVWHDHRMHTMPGAPEVSEWAITIRLDAVTTMVLGSLTQLPAPSPLPWIALAGFVAVALVIFGRRSFTRIGGIVSLGVALCATIVVVNAWLATPSVLGRSVIPLCVGLAAVIASAVALFINGRVQLVVVFASLALSAGILASTSSALGSALIPGPIAPAIIRALLAAALGGTVAAAGLFVLSAGDGLSAPDLPARPAGNS